ncbi:tyrosinase domain protein [Metarhizium acridum CQMa 102]|uniref:tyrosinase n=1 Tax=Metarhizium acridum (strain CQMa 102) TaxID=655827 RepID=E9E1B7_METAQ|nr:tyrosinase domain protein [Metarhizium acridum CQMa 102]EFY90419.1 tyrosinase domain protein [Metarhizium acridum CQMa 102]
MTYAITGIPLDSGPIPVRKDIDDWYREQTSQGGNRIQLTLFVEALTAMQKRHIDHNLSYFRLAGIHSAPWAKWDGKAQPSPETGRIRGYCVHNHYTFPTWHRVYMLLFEQVVYEAMIDFIKTTDKVPNAVKAKWTAEAKQWRLPYWDFARFAIHQGKVLDELRLPILATIPEVRVITMIDPKTGQNSLKNIPNPMYCFKTAPPMGELTGECKIASESMENGGSLPWDKCASTTKYGLLDGFHADVWVDGGQNWLRSNLALNEHPWYQDMKEWDSVPTLQDMTFRLLTCDLNSWGSFSSTRFYDKESQPKDWLSLEAVHNNIHVSCTDGRTLPEEMSVGLTLRRIGWEAGNSAALTRIVGNSGEPATWEASSWLLLTRCSGHTIGKSSVRLLIYARNSSLFLTQAVSNIDRLTAIWQKLNPGKWFDDPKSQSQRNNYLSPFHKDTRGTLYRSDDVQDCRVLHYEYDITRSDPSVIKQKIQELYGNKTMHIYKQISQRHQGVLGDYIVTVLYDRYALAGRPFVINIFFGAVDGRDFYGPESRNFVGSVFNFSGPLDVSGCGKCREQREQGVMSVSQIPATLSVHWYMTTYSTVPRPSYVVVDSVGKVSAGLS